jgi:hypothetical protein
MWWQSLLRATICTATLLAHSAAQAAVSEATLERLKDHALSLQLEQALVAAIRNQDRKALATLASPTIREEFATFAALGVGKGLRTAAAQDLALKLGPCHYAGLTIRGLIVTIAEKRVKPVPKSKPLEVVPEGLDTLFVENMHRCEVINKLPATQRLIGRSCAIDGKDCRPTD